jgi:hypothetical protein
MLPWFWYWAPQHHYPFSGGVAQQFDLERFFNAIPPNAGNGEIEKRAFGIASYGRQIGWLTEVILQQLDNVPAPPDSALAKLRDVQCRIEEAKDGPVSAQRIEETVRALARHGGEPYAQLRNRLLPLLT